MCTVFLTALIKHKKGNEANWLRFIGNLSWRSVFIISYCECSETICFHTPFQKLPRADLTFTSPESLCFSPFFLKRIHTSLFPVFGTLTHDCEFSRVSGRSPEDYPGLWRIWSWRVRPPCKCVLGFVDLLSPPLCLPPFIYCSTLSSQKTLFGRPQSEWFFWLSSFYGIIESSSRKDLTPLSPLTLFLQIPAKEIYSI